jgi:hypothetical protein
MGDAGYVTTANARVEYHRNGVGGEGYYTIAFDSPDADPPILEIGQRMMAIVPARCTTDDLGWRLPVRGTHIPELLVIDPADAMPFATGEGHMGNWRGADYYSQLIMTILWDYDSQPYGGYSPEYIYNRETPSGLTLAPRGTRPATKLDNPRRISRGRIS